MKSFLNRVFMPKTTVPFRPLIRDGALELRAECVVEAADVTEEDPGMCKICSFYCCDMRHIS